MPTPEFESHAIPLSLRVDSQMLRKIAVIANLSEPTVRSLLRGNPKARQSSRDKVRYALRVCGLQPSDFEL